MTSPLGKGLSALLGDINQNIKSDNLNNIIDIEQIFPNPDQPRKYFSEEKINELVLSINAKGVLQPLIVRKKNDIFEIVAGERRWRACQKAGIKQVPVVIVDCNDKEALELALIENLQRQDLNPIEEAESLKALQENHSKNQEEIAISIGKSRSYVANMLRLNNLPDFVKEKIRDGKISAGHAKMLINTENTESIIDTILKDNLSVRETEKLVKNLKNPPKAVLAENSVMENDTYVIAQRLSKQLNTKVNLKIGRYGGVVNIYFNSYEQLDNILQLIDLNND
jgi:ParB family chromosome partitioning protein